MDAVLHGAQYRKDHGFRDDIELGKRVVGPMSQNHAHGIKV